MRILLVGRTRTWMYSISEVEIKKIRGIRTYRYTVVGLLLGLRKRNIGIRRKIQKEKGRSNHNSHAKSRGPGRVPNAILIDMLKKKRDFDRSSLRVRSSITSTLPNDTDTCRPVTILWGSSKNWKNILVATHIISSISFWDKINKTALLLIDNLLAPKASDFLN